MAVATDAIARPARPTTMRRAAVAGALAAAVGVATVIVAGWRGADLPAQIFRVELFRASGFAIWNNQWFGGHHTPGYSVLFPPLGAALGPLVVGGASTVVAAAALGDLLERVAPRSAPAGAVAFALVFPANLAVGRLTFALGVAVGLVSLVALARGRWGAAVVAALLTPLASPVAGAFLALAALAWAAPTWRSWRDPLAVGDRRGRGPVLALAALGPIVVIAVLFPSGGTFPFALGGLLAGLATTVGLVLAVPPRHRAIRAGAAMATLALIAAFVLPTPMGANAARLPMFFALPIVVAIVAPRRPVVATIGGVLLVVWAWQPAMDAVLAAPADPSVDAAFHAPLVAALRVEGHGEARVEIVPTARHWEVVHVAPHVPLARGWERQLDRRYNPVFYGDDLDALSYRGWLEANAVRFVALPDAELDPSGEGEAELIELGLPYLRPVWDDEHWQLFEVIGGVDLVAGPAELVELTADRVVLRVSEPGVVTVRVRHGPHWTASGGACVAADDDGWIVVHAEAAGRVELTQGIDPAAPLTGSPGTCDPGP